MINYNKRGTQTMFDITMHNVWRGMRSAFFVATLVSLSACSGGGGPTEPSNKGLVTGTYTLEEVDDEELPVAVHRGAYWDPDTGEFWNNYVVEVKGGYIELR